ncbi:MAG: hypothetical protein QXX08_02365 [Candidatus Bathyarchaeia archaeon]
MFGFQDDSKEKGERLKHDKRRRDLSLEICCNKIKVLKTGKGTLVCCVKPMKLVKS